MVLAPRRHIASRPARTVGLSVFETIANPNPQTVARIKDQVAAVNGWLAIHVVDGRVFVLDGDAVECRPDVVEFVDETGEKIALSYVDIAAIETGHD